MNAKVRLRPHVGKCWDCRAAAPARLLKNVEIAEPVGAPPSAGLSQCIVLDRTLGRLIWQATLRHCIFATYECGPLIPLREVYRP